MNVSGKQIRLARFWKKFLRLTRGRVPVLRAVEIITGEEADPSFKKVLCSIREELNGGSTLSEVIGKHPAEFSPSVVELIRTAEKSGAWDEILQEVADGLHDGTFD